MARIGLHKTTALVFALIAALSVVPLATAQSADEETTESTKVEGKIDEDGLALSFGIEESEGTSEDASAAAPAATTEAGSSAPWYQNPVTMGILGVAFLAVLILSILAVRGSGSATSARA